jgi:hypothetical protein
MDSESIIANLIPLLVPWWGAIVGISQLMGFIVFGIGLKKLGTSGRHQQQSGGSWSGIVAGILMVNIVGFLDAVAQSTLAKSSQNGLEGYNPANGSDPAALYVQFGIYVVMLVGIVGVVRGLFLVKQAAEDSKQMGSAITHIVGGTMGVNIEGFLRMLAASLGGDISAAINKILN